MADTITIADWQALQALIQEGNAAVSGMSAAEAQAALGANANSGLYVYQGITAAGANNIVNFPNATTAAEAAAEYIAAGGATSSAGAATAATGAAENVANMTIIKGGAEGTSGVAGLLAMPLPTAAAAIAPLAGVALGTGLYALNPELWTRISQTLLPFCYDDSELLPVVADENGNTFYSEEVINAFKGIGFQPSGGVATYDLYPEVNVPYLTGSFLATNGYFFSDFDYYYSIDDKSTTGYFVQKTKRPIKITYKDGTVQNFPVIGQITQSELQTRYWNATIASGAGNVKSATPANTDYKIFETVLVEGSHEGGLPTGIGQWKGNTYPESAEPINVLTGYDEEGKPIFTPYYPAATPIGDPGVSSDPAVNPDPSVNPNPKPAIEPYISPVPDPSKYPENVPVPQPAPLPNPVPAPQPVPDPNVDPSKDPSKQPDNPNYPKPPTDIGASGSPVIPIIPTLPSAATGLLHVYNPTQAQIDSFGSWLWTTFSGDLIDTLSKLFNDPMDAVIGLHELYATPSTQGDTTIKAGYLDSGVSSKLVGNRYTTINCGSVVVEEYYQNYLDYSPYTQVYIYLPFIGIVPVSADDIIGNAVNIIYHIDSYTGCCIAVITVAKKGYSSTVYQFEGNCAVEIPITSGYQSSLMAGLIGVAGTAISGSPAVGITAAHIGRAGLGKNAVSHSGSFGSSYGAMGCKIPYIIVRRPVQKKITDYSKSYGYPAHKMVYVGNCNGYLRAKEVRIKSTTATNAEKEMIVSALKSGVYVN